MANKKITRRALVMSVISLILCCAMLVGTTFAWFTDSVSSGVNRIQSGNLDVTLEYKTSVDGAWTEVKEDTKIFNPNALYEPGYTEVVFLRVSNVGNLALQYNLNVNVYGETLSTNVLNQEYSLKDYLEIGYYSMDESLGQHLLSTMFGTREAALQSVPTNKLSADTGIICQDAPLVANTNEQYSPLLVALVLTMPETVGNEANHKTGVEAPTIDLGVSLVATQYTAEEDSFGSNYDENAAFPNLVSTAADLAEALKNGKNVVLTDDVSMQAATTAPYGNKYAVKLDGGVLDGNGNELNVKCNGDDYGIMTSGGTVKNLTIKEGCRAVMIMSPTEDIILDNVNIGGNGVLYPINTGEAGSEGVNLFVTNSTLAGWTSYGNIESASFTNVTFKQGTYYNNNIYGRVLKPYVNTTLTNCSFVEHMNLDLSALTEGHKITMTNCTVNGQVVTADEFTVPSTDAEYDTALFTVDLPSWATSIADCIIFG